MTEVVLIVTASAESAAGGTLLRFLRSALRADGVTAVCVARGWDRELIAANLDEAELGRLVVLSTDSELSLSAARNVALRWICEHLSARAQVLGFPDDDCWYQSDTIEAVLAAFAALPDAAVLVGQYGPSPEMRDRKRFPAIAENLSPCRVARRASSVTIFVRYASTLTVGGFNPRLGVGTAAGSGEDLDYLFRLMSKGASAVYRPEIFVGHAYASKGDRSYAAGSLLVLAIHLFSFPSLVVQLVRTLIGSLRSRHQVAGRSRFAAVKMLWPPKVYAMRRDTIRCDAASAGVDLAS